MLCSRIRTALSARLDGEELPPGVTARRLGDHLAGCTDCRRWEAQARALAARLDRTEAHDGRGLPDTGRDDGAALAALLAGLRAASVGTGTAGPHTGGDRAG
ncbi:zf-HC2 domain-containing protein [Streptomyces sp. NPDC020742]|uniref:zf-HC2 domain-containing protein n=1 Tax=Streptomyces sp. NPDC020742 TaxID=3154897 RepID=UPI0033E3BCF4